jgi:peptidyl-prolyl cis-trans isomerase SurA
VVKKNRAIFLFILIMFSVSVRAEIVDRIVAVVNNEFVTESNLKTLRRKAEASGAIDELLLLGKSVQDLKNNRKDQIDYLVNERLLDSEVKRLNLSVTIERVEQEIRDKAKSRGVSRAELLNFVKSQGMTVSDYQDFVKSQIERQSLIQSEITSKIRVTDEDILAEYSRAYPQSSAAIYEYTLAHILFNPKKGGPDAALERAENVYKKLRSGESFEVLAEQNSEDPNFTSGGLLGSFKAGEFGKELEGAVSSLKPGEYSTIVKTKSGFHIIKLLGKKIVTDPRFEKEKEKISSRLLEKAFQKQFKLWVEAKRDESFIKINHP